jgi:hypothetical protein
MKTNSNNANGWEHVRYVPIAGHYVVTLPTARKHQHVLGPFETPEAACIARDAVLERRAKRTARAADNIDIND